MRNTTALITRVRKALESVSEQKRLTGVMRKMARELERLDEENRQLQAAVSIYREVVRRSEMQQTSTVMRAGSASM